MKNIENGRIPEGRETQETMWPHMQACILEERKPKLVPDTTFAFLREVVERDIGQNINPDVRSALDIYYGTDAAMKDLREQVPAIGAERQAKRNMLGALHELHSALIAEDPSSSERYKIEDILRLKNPGQSLRRRDTTDVELWEYAQANGIVTKLEVLGVLTPEEVRRVTLLFTTNSYGEAAFSQRVMDIVSVAVAQSVAEIPLRDRDAFLASVFATRDRGEQNLLLSTEEVPQEEDAFPENIVIFDRNRLPK